MSSAAVIKELHIERFRGIEKLEWQPADTANVVLGGGDTGKTTLLDAIALLLSPTNSVMLSEADYWQKQSENGFLIRAFFSLPPETDINQQRALAWPWEWNGEGAVVPALDDDDDATGCKAPLLCTIFC